MSSEPDTQWPVVTPGFMYIVKFGDFAHILQPADRKSSEYLMLAQVAVRDINIARKLLNERGPFLLPDKQNRVDETISETENAINRVFKLLEPSRVECIDEQSIRLHRDNPWTLEDDPKSAATFSLLRMAHKTLEIVLYELNNIEPTIQSDDYNDRADADADAVPALSPAVVSAPVPASSNSLSPPPSTIQKTPSKGAERLARFNVSRSLDEGFPEAMTISNAHPAKPTDINGKLMSRFGGAAKIDAVPDPSVFTDSGYKTMSQPMPSISGSGLVGRDVSSDHTSLEDNMTEYSVDSIDTPRDDLVEDFSQQLFADLRAANLTRDEFEEQFYDMEEVFLDFALRLGHVDSSAGLLKAQKFIHRHRIALGKSFAQNFFQDVLPTLEDNLERYSDSSNESQLHHRPSGMAMSIDAKMEMWESKMSTEMTYEAEKVEENHSSLDILKHAVYNSVAYTWLLRSLGSRFLLVNDNRDVFLSIKNAVNESLPRPKQISRRTVLPACSIVFEAEWPLKEFLDYQWPTWHDTGWIGDIVTLTGTGVDVQATTCKAYLEQTWPLIGVEVLKLVDGVLHGKPAAHCRLFDQTEVRVYNTGENFVFRVDGVRGTVIEVGEQLCWLVHALSVPKKLGLSIPVLESQSQPLEGLPPTLRILSQWQPLEVNHAQQGNCWHKLFGSADIVSGFPILRRARPGLGLEIHLEIAAALIGAQYLTRHDSIDSLQSSSAVIYARDRLNDTILWHLDVAHDGMYSTFPRGSVDLLQSGQSVVDFARHIVGWSEQARHNAGSGQCNYEIGPTRTRQADRQCALHTSVLTPVTPIPHGQPFQIMRGQYPPYRASHELPTMMRRLGRRFVCFLDIDEQRAWLTDGVAALAHLVRGSIASDKNQTPEFMQLEMNPLHEPSEWKFSNASSLFLCHVSNQQVPVLSYPHKGEMKEESFEDRIAQSYHLLDSAFAYQEKFKKSIKKSPRTLLEGWDFHDLTWRRDDPHNARYTILNPKANGWVNLLREIDAITIFGQGFGEMIEPVSDPSRPLCGKWTTMPTGHCYIAASYAVLRKIILHHGGDGLTSPVRLTKKTSLIVPSATFDCCGCRSGRSRSEPVQVLWPTKMLNDLDYVHSSKASLAEVDGAIVLGHNEAHDWHWPDHGEPQRGPAPAPLIEDDSDSDGSIEHSTFERATDSQNSQSATSPNTFISGLDKSISQSSQHHQNAYGHAKVDGDGRLIMGNVYITNNSAMTGADFGPSHAIQKVTNDKAGALGRPPSPIREEQREQLPSSSDTRCLSADRLAVTDASNNLHDSKEPDGAQRHKVPLGQRIKSRFGSQVARAFSQPRPKSDAKRK